MATEDTTPGNSDESSNRTFMIAAGVLGLVFIAGLIIVVVMFTSQSSGRQAQQATLQAATAAALILAQVTDTPEPTLPPPTETTAPTPTPTRPAPTQTFTPAPVAATVEVTGTTRATAAVEAGTPAAGTPAAGTAVARVSPTTAGTKALTAGAAAAGTTAPSATPGGAGTVPQTGIGDMLGLVLAVALVALMIVARRIRTAQA